MKKIAIVTDSNSGITQDMAKELQVTVLPMPFYINEQMYLEGISLTQPQFYEMQDADADISTSQPSPGEVTDIWDELLKEYDEIIHIPMSSGLSASCATAIMLSKEEEYENRVFVVDNQRISIIQYTSVLDAIDLVNAGKTAAEVKEILEEEKLNASVYLTLETLKHLKKGGRITPAAAAIGTVLNLKPVLQIQGEKLDAFAKCRGKKQAKRTMIKAIQKDMEERFAQDIKDGTFRLLAAYGGNEEEAMEWKKELEELFPDFPIFMMPLSLSVACHIGKGILAVAGVKRVDVTKY